MLSLTEVAKEYDFYPVLHGINLDLIAGTSYALMAPNGSGKTTLLSMMAGLSRPSSGKVLWKGKPLNRNYRREVGIVLQTPFLFGALTGLENLSLYAALYGLPDRQDACQRWLAMADLTQAAGVRVQDYSKGMKQRLSIVRAMLHQPSLYLLDEPFDGLDVKATDMFQSAMIAEVKRGATVFMVTHQIADAKTADVQFTLRSGTLEPVWR